MPRGTGQRYDPLRNFRFEVGIDGVADGGFQKVSGLSSEVAVIEYREGTDQPHVRKITGLETYEDVTFERGIVQTDSDLWEFMSKSYTSTENSVGSYHDFRDDISQYHINITVTAKNKAGNIAKVWVLHNAFASKYTVGDMSGDTNEVLLTTLQISYEWLTVTEYDYDGNEIL